MPTKNNHIFVISDIHGCAIELEKLLSELPVQDNSEFVFLGDYIDRGEDSKKVIDIVLALQKKYQVITLMGNHEQMLLHFIEEHITAAAASFVFNGGGATLASYGDHFGNFEIPESHMKFYKSLKLYYETDDYFFVHAGLPDVNIKDLVEEKDEWSMLWIREEFFKSTFQWGKLIIHGHTPVPKCLFSKKRINIDTGCVYGQTLTALELPSKKIYEVKKIHPAKHYFLRDMNSRRRAVRFDAIIPVLVECHDRGLSFNTVNYSEFGMYISDIQMPHTHVFEEGEVLKGTLGEVGTDQAYFEGKVVRSDKIGWAHYYAIEFYVTPFETMDRHL